MFGSQNIEAIYSHNSLNARFQSEESRKFFCFVFSVSLMATLPKSATFITSEKNINESDINLLHSYFPFQSKLTLLSTELNIIEDSRFSRQTVDLKKLYKSNTTML